MSNPATPRSGTPIQRIGTPGRGSGRSTPIRSSTPVIFNASEKLVKDPPNNLNYQDPRFEQGVTNNLIGNQNTKPVEDNNNITEEERIRIETLVTRLNNKK